VPELRRPPATTGPLTLRTWQLADWRFLLPPDVQRVGYVEELHQGEHRVLEAAGLQLVNRPGPDNRVAVTVIASPRERLVSQALRGLEAGGWVVLRLHGGAGRPLRRAAVRRRWLRWLSRRGFSDIRLYWHAPDAERCSYLVDVRDRRAVDLVLSRHHGVPRGRTKSFLARTLNRAGLIAALAGDLTLVARDAGSSTGPWPLPPGVPADVSMAGAPGHLAAEGWSSVLVTPWFEASRHVLALLVPPGGREVAAVVKVPRRPWDVGGIEQEREALQAVAAAGSTVSGAAPVVLGSAGSGPRPFLLQSGVGGTPVAPEVVRRSPDRVLQAGLDLTARLAAVRAGGRSATVADLLEPLHRLAHTLPGHDLSDLVRRTQELLQPLEHEAVPAVLEHGDLGHPNLFLQPGGTLTAVDWERAHTSGLPACDLVFFLQYFRECTASADTLEGQLAAFDATFVGPGAWARRHLSDYAQGAGFSSELLPHLVLATWARAAAGLLDRLRAGSPEASNPPAADTEQIVGEVLVADRDFALWRHALGRFGALLG
jgi:aminoglycoside phosphotransferase (APT) family kinase protein